MIKITTLDVGLNRIRDLFEDDIHKCQAGTGTTAPQETDTGLESEVTATSGSTSNTTTDKQLLVSREIGLGTGNGNTISEFSIRDSTDAIHHNHVTFTGVDKANTAKMRIRTKFFIRGRIE